MSGLFITFEGPDGAGKTTQIKHVSAWLNEQGMPHICTREPGGTAISDKVRDVLLNPAHREMADETEVLLYAASRAQLVNEVIRPALQENHVVLCDRYVDASLAYQGFGLGRSLEQIIAVNQFATGGLLPQRTYLLDVPVQIGLKRILRKRIADRIEQKDIAYHTNVRHGFLTLAEQEPERFYRIDATQAEMTVFLAIQTDLERLLSLGGK